MNSRRPLSEYPAAWAEYRKRRRLAWAVPLALLALYVGSGLARQGVPWTPLLVAAILSYGILLGRFVHWRCPRCGQPFTKVKLGGFPMMRQCASCGLAAGTEGEAGRS